MTTAASSTISQESQPPEPNPNSISTTNSDHQGAQDDFLEQMISLPSWAKNSDRSPFSSSHKLFPTLPFHNSTTNNPNADDFSPDDHPRAYDDDSTDSAGMASRQRHHRANGGGRQSLGFLQLNAADLGLGNGCTSPVASCISDANGLPLQMSLGQGGHQDSSLHSQLLVERNRDDIDAPFENNLDVRGLYNEFHTGRTGANGNLGQHFQNYGCQNVGMNPTSSSGGAPPAANRLRVRARRGQATDPHSIAERLRRERIAERMKVLQELVPNANKTDKASMLDEIIDYVKFLQLQVKILSMSRLGAAAAVSPFVADISSAEASGGLGTRSIAIGIGSDQGATAATTSASNGLSTAENQVAKLMEEDMGSAMQYLQGKGLCLMPISLASAISTTTCHAKNPATTNNNKTATGSGGISPLTVHSDLGKNSGIDGGEETVKDSTTTKR